MKKLILIFPVVLAVFVLFTGCKKEEPTPATNNNNTNTTSTTSASSSPQFTGTMSGTALNHTNLNVGYTSGGNVGSGSGDPSTLNYGFILLNSSFEPVVQVEKGTLNLPNGFYPSNSEFDAFFPLGTSNFDPTLSDGVVISYTNSSGVTWSTASGTADQTGSTFEIVDRVVAELNGDHVVKVKIVANCILYDGMGGSSTLENAVIIGRFANI